MKCSNCKLEGYNKNNCPNCKEKNEERINRLLEILPLKTVFVALAYVSLSQLLQKQGPVADLLGTGGDLIALKSPDAGIFLGGMASLAVEQAADGFDIVNWFEEQAKAFETLSSGLDPKAIL